MNKVSLTHITPDCDTIKGYNNCIYCDNGEYSIIEMISFSKGIPIQQEILDNKLIFLMKGKIKYSYSIYTEIEVNSGSLFLLPKGCIVSVDFLEDTMYFCYRFESLVEYSDKFQLSELLNNYYKN